MEELCTNGEDKKTFWGLISLGIVALYAGSIVITHNIKSRKYYLNDLKILYKEGKIKERPNILNVHKIAKKIHYL